MPLSRLELRNEYGLGDRELYRNPASGKDSSEAILFGVAVSGLVGILRMLGDVAEFGAEIFHDLHEQVMITSARGQKMLSRIKKIEEALPSIEEAIHSKASYIDLAYETGSGWHADLRIMDSHLSCDDLPQFIMDSYEECRDPPRLYLLDKYDRAGTGACLKRYSDPSYFKRAWASSEQVKAQQIQKETKLQNIKRKYSRLREAEVQGPISASQCNSLASSARFAPLSNDDHCFSADSSSVSEIRLKSEVISGPQLLNTVSKLACTRQASETNHSAMPSDLEHDKLSVSNIQNNHRHSGAAQLHNDELVFDVDDDSQYDFLHWKCTPPSPSVIWDEKSELAKAVGLKLSNDTPQDSKRLFVNSGVSKVEKPTRTRSLKSEKPLPIIADLPSFACDQNQFEDVYETDNYVDALNTLESEAEMDCECQTKYMRSLSNMRQQKNESGAVSVAQYDNYSHTEIPMPLHDSSNKYRLPSDTYLDVSGMVKLMQSTQEAGFSPGSPYDGSQPSENSVLTISRTIVQETDDDQLPWSTDAKSETVLNSETAAATSEIQISPPISISNISSTKLWTNGNLLGLKPSKPVDISLPNESEKMTQPNSLNNGVKSDKQNMVNGKISKQLNSIGEVQGSPESLSLTDQSILRSNSFLSKKYHGEENSSMKHPSAYIENKDDGFGLQLQQKAQQPEAHLFIDKCEGSQIVFPNVLTTCISQMHQITKSASSKESEPCSAFSHASPSMDSVHNSKCLSPRFSELPQRNGQCRQIKPPVTRAKSSTQNEPVNAACGQSEEKPLTENQRKRLNEVASQPFYEQNLAPRTFHEMSLISKSDYELLEKSVSSSSHYPNSSPPLEHMKILFNPMNSLEAANLKLELPDGYLNERIDESVLPSFRLFPGCTLPAQDCGSESDDDTFCKSYPYSTEDLLSARSDSNSELWEHDDFSGSKTNELSDDLRRISSSTASISSCSGFDQINHVDQEIGSKGLCIRNDIDSFQPSFTTNFPTFESLINEDDKYDSLLSCSQNATAVTITELPPPPPPLPPIQWRLVRSSYELSENNYCNIPQMVGHFEDSQNQCPPAPAQFENIIGWPIPLADEQYNKLQDNQKLNSLVQTDKLDRKEQLLYQIRDTEIQHKLKPCEELKSQISNSEGIDEKDDLLNQIRTKTFNLRRTATSRSSLVTQPTTNDRVAAILEKANAIRQACASSDEDENNDDWSDS